MRTSTRLLAAGLASGVTMLFGVTAAFTSEKTEEAQAASQPPPIVEDYSYPGSDRIFTERGIKLIKGDGNIVLVDCGSAQNLIAVYSSAIESKFCFEVTGSAGYLTMEVPDVYAIGGNDNEVEATITVGNDTKIVDVEKNKFTPVGEGGSPESAPATLLEIRAS